MNENYISIRNYRQSGAGLACGGSIRQPGIPQNGISSRKLTHNGKLTNEAMAKCDGVASVCCRVCGNGTQRSWQALILVTFIKESNEPLRRMSKKPPDEGKNGLPCKGGKH